MQKLLGVYILAIAITCGLAFEGPSALSAPGSVAAPCPVGKPAEIHYAPDEDLESIDVALVGQAVKQIDMAAYVLTDRAIIEALRQAAARGVKVQILARPGPHGREGWRGRRAGPSSLDSFQERIEIRPNPPGDELRHLKGYCVDHRLLKTGSANLSPSGETREAALISQRDAGQGSGQN